MTRKKTQSSFDMKLRRIRNPHVRGAASIFDVFGVASSRPKFGSTRDDWRQVANDFAAVGDDVRDVLSAEQKKAQ
jgi:hypothetical protein